MGFGLHQGWAIEGAIGSEFKIDASYLSPNVNMASRLEAATRQFGVPMLISESLYDICTLDTQLRLRKVDRVTVKGSKFPLDLYTCDIDLDALERFVNNGEEDYEIVDIDQARISNRAAREALMEQILSETLDTCNIFDSDIKLSYTTSAIPSQFVKAYAIALNDYLQGNWIEARAGFIHAQTIKGKIDGPCEILIEFIDELNCKAPKDWNGYRELHDK